MRDAAWRRRTGAKVATGVVVAAAVAGAVVLGLALDWRIPAGVAIFAVVATWRAFGRRLLEAVCAAAIALLALVALAAGIRGTLDLFTDWRLPIPAGLVLALLVFFGVAVWYLGGNWLGGRNPGAEPVAGERRVELPSPRWGWRGSIIGAALLAIVVILGLPVLVGLSNKPDERPIAKEQAVVSKIDAFIVADPALAGRPAVGTVPERVRARLGPYAHAEAFSVRWSVGFATADGVRWTLAGSDKEQEAFAALAEPGAPAVEAPGVTDADRVLLLLVDGTPAVIEGDAAARPEIRRGKKGEVARWRRVAAAAVPPMTPSYPLLETTDEKRRDAWTAFAGPRKAVRIGEAISLQRFGGRTVTDAAIRLAVGAPTAQEDYSLALRHRPILRFDNGEAAPRPLSVDALFATGNVRLCVTKQAPGDLKDGNLGTTCNPVSSAAKLRKRDAHIELPLPKAETLRDLAREERDQLAASPAPGASRLGEGSAIYVHPVPSDSEDASLLYLDYWWYLPYNPANSGAGAFCGPGFVIPGISCFDHVSDWEGVTVVLDRTTPGIDPTPKAVHYAQHSGVARYSWDELRTAWRGDENAARILERTPDAAGRPLVFVASGTHAAYPLPCRQASQCRQVLEEAEEKRHDGRMQWAGNDTPKCGADDCLKLLPTARGGRVPALWNDFDGPWGTRHCWLTYYCDSGSPPEAPGQQGRYERPWDHDGTHKPSDGQGRRD